jgi:hypothetical protein
MVDWLRQVWGRKPGPLLKKRRMLVLGVFRHHLTEKVKTETSNINTQPETTPRGMTSHRFFMC